MTTQDLFERICAIIRPLGSVAVGFSGGVDSAVVAALALQALGPGSVIVVTADSESLPRRELEDARWLAEEIGVPHSVMPTRELDCDDYAANSPERCYHCKSELWSRMRDFAAGRGIANLADGVNADDLADHRPGIRASDEAGVVHPLAEAGAGKEDVRALARRMGLSVWDKPAQACLSSRFPYGERITAEGLRRVEQAEEMLRRMGMLEVRVRSHGDVARIEVPAGLLAELAADWRREPLVSHLKELGFRYVSLDLEGFRSGSMNEALS